MGETDGGSVMSACPVFSGTEKTQVFWLKYFRLQYVINMTEKVENKVLKLYYLLPIISTKFSVNTVTPNNVLFWFRPWMGI